MKNARPQIITLPPGIPGSQKYLSLTVRILRTRLITNHRHGRISVGLRHRLDFSLGHGRLSQRRRQYPMSKKPNMDATIFTPMPPVTKICYVQTIYKVKINHRRYGPDRYSIPSIFQGRQSYQCCQGLVCPSHRVSAPVPRVQSSWPVVP